MRLRDRIRHLFLRSPVIGWAHGTCRLPSQFFELYLTWEVQRDIPKLWGALADLSRLEISGRSLSELREKVRRLDGADIRACTPQVKLPTLWASLGVNYVW